MISCSFDIKIPHVLGQKSEYVASLQCKNVSNGMVTEAERPDKELGLKE